MIASSEDRTNECGFKRRAHREPFVAATTNADTSCGIQGTDANASTQGILYFKDAVIDSRARNGRADQQGRTDKEITSRMAHDGCTCILPFVGLEQTGSVMSARPSALLHFTPRSFAGRIFTGSSSDQ